MNTHAVAAYRRVGADVRLAIHWTVLCLLIPLIIILPNLTNRASIAAFFPAIVIVYSGTRLAQIAARGIDRIVEMTFWLYTYIFLGLSAFLQTAADIFPWPDHYSTYEIAEAHLLVIVGIIAFDFGYRVCLKSAKYPVPRSKPVRTLARRRIYILSLLGLMVSVYATIKLGGLATLFLNRNARFALLSESHGIAAISIYNSLAKTVPYTLLIIAAAYRMRESQQRLIFNALVTILALLTLIENNPIATARFQVGTILLGVYFVAPWKPYKAKLAVYALILGLVLVFPYADLFRASNNASLSDRIQKYENRFPLATKVDYDSFQQIVNGIRMVERDGFEYGKQLLGATFFWVPRSVWTTKPEPTGPLIAERNSYTFTNLSAPLWIEFYVDGGWILVLVGFAAYGYVVRRLDYARQGATSRTAPAYVFATIYSGYQIFLLRGSLLPAVAYITPIIPIIWLCSTRRKNQKATTPVIAP